MSRAGLPRRLGLRAGQPRASPAPPGALAACVARGRAGGRGLVAARKADGQRPRGGGRGARRGRRGASRTARGLSGWPTLAALVRRRRAAGMGQVADAVGQWPRRPGAKPWPRSAGAAATRARGPPRLRTPGPPRTRRKRRRSPSPARVSQRGGWRGTPRPRRRVPRTPGQGRRGRPPRPWRYHALPDRVAARQQRPQRTQRGRPPPTELPQATSRSRRRGEAEAPRPSADTQAGLGAARARGRIGGRRPKLRPQQQAAIVDMVHTGRQSRADAARLFRVHPATVSRLVAAHRQQQLQTRSAEDE